jgi:hypothetical protein
VRRGEMGDGKQKVSRREEKKENRRREIIKKDNEILSYEERIKD